MTDKELSEMEDLCRAYEIFEPNARMTELLRIATDELKSLKKRSTLLRANKGDANE